MNLSRWLLVTLASVGATLTGNNLIAQGCVAAHSNQRVISELVKTEDGRPNSLFSIHNLTEMANAQAEGMRTLTTLLATASG